MSDSVVTPVSMSTSLMAGWWVEMRPSTFVLCAPAARPFERCALGWRTDLTEAEPMRVALVAASRWHRSVWRFNPAEGFVFGVNRRVRVVAVGAHMELRCADLIEEEPVTTALEFNYIELPALRAAVARRARPRRRQYTLEKKEPHEAANDLR